MSLNNGIVLPGITRASIISLLNDHAAKRKDFPLDGVSRNVRVVERDIAMSEVVDSAKDGSLKGSVVVPKNSVLLTFTCPHPRPSLSWMMTGLRRISL